MTAHPARIGALISAQRQAQRTRLRIAAAGGAIVAVAATCLLGLSGWFITGAAIAGVAGSAAVQTFNYLMPSATIRLLAILRTAARHIERVAGHEAPLKGLARLRPPLPGRLVSADPAVRGSPTVKSHADIALLQAARAVPASPLRCTPPSAGAL